MMPSDLKVRTRIFATDVIRLVRELPQNVVTTTITRQLLKSATSIGANYRASCRAKSRADFLSKMTTVEEEADETIYWMELLVESGCVHRNRVDPLLDEANQLTAIVVASIKTARRNRA